MVKMKTRFPLSLAKIPLMPSKINWSKLLLSIEIATTFFHDRKCLSILIAEAMVSAVEAPSTDVVCTLIKLIKYYFLPICIKN